MWGGLRDEKEMDYTFVGLGDYVGQGRLLRRYVTSNDRKEARLKGNNQAAAVELQTC